MPTPGFEPGRPYEHRNLNPARLPIFARRALQTVEDSNLWNLTVLLFSKQAHSAGLCQLSSWCYLSRGESEIRTREPRFPGYTLSKRAQSAGLCDLAIVPTPGFEPGYRCRRRDLNAVRLPNSARQALKPIESHHRQRSVPAPGIEPGRLAATDFKSAASTNSSQAGNADRARFELANRSYPVTGLANQRNRPTMRPVQSGPYRI